MRKRSLAALSPTFATSSEVRALCCARSEEAPASIKRSSRATSDSASATCDFACRKSARARPMSTLSRVTTTAPRATDWPGATGTLATRPEICGPMRATRLGTKSTEPATVRLERRGTRCTLPVASLAPASARGDKLTSTSGSFFSRAGSLSTGGLQAPTAKAANAKSAYQVAKLLLTTGRSVPDLSGSFRAFFGYGHAVVDHRNRRFRTAHLWQVVSALVVICLGSLIVSSKLGAKAASAPRSARRSPQKPARSPNRARARARLLRSQPQIRRRSPPPASRPAPSAAPAAPAPSAASASSEAASGDKDDISNLTLGGAVIQDESDIPQGLSPEQIDSLGNGKVPIHRDGKFRSPLANPTSGGPATVKVGLVVSEIRDYQITDGSFSADFFLSFTADKLLPKLHPVFTNGHDVNCTSLVDVETFRFYRCTGTFTSGVDLRELPVRHAVSGHQRGRRGVRRRYRDLHRRSAPHLARRQLSALRLRRGHRRGLGVQAPISLAFRSR